MVHSSLYSSQSEDWETPQQIFDQLNAIFDFKLDACASAQNAKCRRFFSITENALKREWHPFKSVWMNPPYGRSIQDWMRKAYDESIIGCVVVCLVPVRTDTRWWHNWVYGKGHVTYIKGRLKFGEAKNSAPFPSAIVTYGIDLHRIINQTK